MTQEYMPTDNEIETAFHEYASRVVKREKEWVPDNEPISYPPEPEDWRCGMAAIRSIKCGQAVHQTVDNCRNLVISRVDDTHFYARFSTPTVCGKSDLLTDFKGVEDGYF